jgi:hypothetical protein
MNLRSVDLNLLVDLDALLRELHVTRAADRIGLSQPAMSNALSRLRYIFKDDLLVRTASGIQATPKALELLEPTRQVIRQIERVLKSDTGELISLDPAGVPLDETATENHALVKASFKHENVFYRDKKGDLFGVSSGIYVH